MMQTGYDSEMAALSDPDAAVLAGLPEEELIDVGTPVEPESYNDIRVNPGVTPDTSPENCMAGTPAEGPVRDDIKGYSREDQAQE